MNFFSELIVKQKECRLFQTLWDSWTSAERNPVWRQDFLMGRGILAIMMLAILRERKQKSRYN